MIRYLFIATEDNQEYYIFYWAGTDYEAIGRAAKEYPNYVSIGIISKHEYDTKQVEDYDDEGR